MQNTLAIEYQNIGNLGEALKHFQIAYALEPKSGILSNIALIYAMEGNFKTSENDYAKLMKIDPHFYPAYINLTHAQLKSNDPVNALKTAKKGLSLFPKSDQLWALLAFAEYKLGNITTAISDLNQAYTLSQNNTYIQYRDIISKHIAIDKYL